MDAFIMGTPLSKTYTLFISLACVFFRRISFIAPCCNEFNNDLDASELT